MKIWKKMHAFSNNMLKWFRLIAMEGLHHHEPTSNSSAFVLKQYRECNNQRANEENAPLNPVTALAGRNYYFSCNAVKMLLFNNFMNV